MPRPLEDEEDDDLIPKRKRRRPKPKPVADEDDEGPGGRKGKPTQDEEDEDDEDETSLSTGNVLLDIVLDFIDDCIDWCKENQIKAIVLGIGILLLFLLFLGVFIYYTIDYINRPTLTLAVMAYDHGSYPEAKMYAESVIKYARSDDVLTRARALFVIGAATCSIADLARTAERQEYYLAAANYLRESAEYGFLPSRRAEGFFLLGKSLYMSGELVLCREPLQRALETAIEEHDSERIKNIEWFLGNSYFLDAEPNYVRALRSLRTFRKQPTVTEAEGYEADLLEAMIQIRLGRIDAAEQAFARVPIFERFATIRAFISGQIALFKARQIRQQASELENSRDVRPVETPISLPPLQLPEEKPIDDLEHLLPSQPQSRTSPKKAPLVPALVPVAGNDSTDHKIVVSHRDTEARRVPGLHAFEPQGEKKTSTKLDSVGYDSPSIIQRVAWLQDEAGRLAPDGDPETSSSPEPTPHDPDMIIVMPSEAEPPKPLPTLFGDPKPIQTLIPTDPRFQKAKELRLRAVEKYKEAIEQFGVVATDEQFQPRWQRQAKLLRGIAYDEMGDDVNAGKSFLQIVEQSPGTSEAVAAEFLWSVIEQRNGRFDTAQAGFGRTFEALRKLPNYMNPWLPKATMLDQSRDTFRQRVLMKEYKESLTLLKHLAGIMPEPERVRQAAGVYERWADDLQRQANVSFLEQRTKLQKEANEKFRLAGDAYAQLAALLFDTTEYTRLLWSSAENYRLGRDYLHGIPAYRRYLKANTQEHQAESLVYIGEMSIHLDRLDEATTALERCIAEYPNHFMVPRARLNLSRAYVEQKEWEKAKKVLELNLIGEFSSSAAIYRDSIYALGKLYFERGDLAGCIPYFEDALKIHPNAIQSPEAHYCLALALLQRSDDALIRLDETTLESTRLKIEADAQIDRTLALERLFKTEEILVKRQEAVGLSEAELLMLRNTFFSIGSIQMKLKQYEQAILTYDLAATRYQDRPESLDALLQIAVAYRILDRPQDAVPILNRAQILLNNLKKANIVPEANNWEEQIETQRNLALFKE